MDRSSKTVYREALALASPSTPERVGVVCARSIAANFHYPLHLENGPAPDADSLAGIQSIRRKGSRNTR